MAGEIIKLPQDFLDEKRRELMEAAKRTLAGALEMGRVLAEVHAKMKDAGLIDKKTGAWAEFVESCRISKPTADGYRHLYEVFAKRMKDLNALGQTPAMALSFPTEPTEARAAAIAVALAIAKDGPPSPNVAKNIRKQAELIWKGGHQQTKERLATLPNKKFEEDGNDALLELGRLAAIAQKTPKTAQLRLLNAMDQGTVDKAEAAEPPGQPPEEQTDPNAGASTIKLGPTKEQKRAGAALMKTQDLLTRLDGVARFVEERIAPHFEEDPLPPPLQGDERRAAWEVLDELGTELRFLRKNLNACAIGYGWVEPHEFVILDEEIGEEKA